jgi:ABC-type nitrate/sulfonate/bicarbonate transport system permease component
MHKFKYLVISVVFGIILSVAFWPVISGVQSPPNCPDGADCLNNTTRTPRIIYYIQGQHFNGHDTGVISSKEYCNIAGGCTGTFTETFFGIVLGGAIGLIFGMFTVRKRSNAKLRSTTTKGSQA